MLKGNSVEYQHGFVLSARFKVEDDPISVYMTGDGASWWTNLRCGPRTVASMTDQGLLLVTRRYVSLGIRPSAETNGKDLGTVKMGTTFEKERPDISLLQSGIYSLELPSGTNRDTSPHVYIVAFLYSPAPSYWHSDFCEICKLLELCAWTRSNTCSSCAIPSKYGDS